ncbi:hypothetical protein PAXRUDRAFT_437362 [Paxillus rubicundulus Ve08.2h10]|uniref:Uncharacterized protein n=1 Tax=Paxillus rubicundulus Ve08.2h10 TaxID=930991 RepID=A0A0D0E2A1_9AGAM|nr:hypothetical protein PAXRUDRAFT_437362 [Paxillus rubicundulus Ve08.2h10]
MQSIQDQQNNILRAVIPLVPLMQSVPSQIDQIKMALSDMVSGAVSSMTKSIDGIKTTLASSDLTHGQERRFVRSSTQMPLSYKTASSSRRKRSRSMAHSSSNSPREINAALSSPSAGRDHGLRLSSSKRLRLDAPTHCLAPTHLSRQLSRPAWPPASIGSAPRRSGVVNLTAIPRTPQTPRQPLVDLIPPSELSNNMVPRATQNIAELTSPLVEYMRSDETLQPPGATSPSIVAQDSVSGPSLPWIPAREAPNDVQDSVVSLGQRQPILPVHAVDLPTTGSAAPNSSSDLSKDAISKAIKVEEVLRPGLSGIFSIPCSPLSPVPSPTPPQPLPNPDTTAASVIRPPTQQQSQAHHDEIAALHSRTSKSIREVIQAPHTSSNPLSSNSDTSQPKSMSLRDRRAQMSVVGTLVSTFRVSL